MNRRKRKSDETEDRSDARNGLLHRFSASPILRFGLISCGISLVLPALTVVLISCVSGPAPPAGQNGSGPPETSPTSNTTTETPAPSVEVKETRTGMATVISKKFHGGEAASGETYDQRQVVAAHPSYPMGTTVRVTNLENERSVEARIVDRSAPGNGAEGIIDLSPTTADLLGLAPEDKAKVRVEVLEWGHDTP